MRLPARRACGKGFARVVPRSYTPRAMEWYYARNDERNGPVSAAEFSRLVADGVVTPDTLVWRDGMTAWQPWREVEPPAPSPAAMCSQCRRMFSESELITLEDQRLCSACKPDYLQQVQEGVEATAPETVLGNQRLTLAEVLALAWSIWLRNFGVILLLTLLVSIPTNLILESLPISDEPSARELGRYFRVTMLLEVLLGTLRVVGIAYVVGEAVAGREATFGAAIRHALSRWLPAIGTSFLENIIVLLLMLLLIVPGIIWMGYYTFTMYVVSLRLRAGKDALDYSKALVRGRWWRVVGFVLATLFIVLLPMTVVGAFAAETTGAAAVVATTITDVMLTFMTVAIGVFFLNLDGLRQAGRLE